MALYRASPLNTYDSIRVLYVHQGRSDTGIEASITIVQLSSKPDFIALSYTWQSPVDEQHASYNKYKHGAYSISVDGERLPIYANLHEALLRMRSMHYHLPLWIDAICIDQKNDSERNHQLSLMPSIYLQASRTVIWLGESELDIRMAVQTLDSLQCQVIEGNLSLSTDYALDVIRKIPGRNRRAIGKLCRRRWFKRLWTLQEVLLPAKTVTLCGEVELDISLLASIATLALQLPAKLEITAFMQQDLGGAAQLRAMAGIAAWLGVAWRGGGFGSRAFLRYPKIDHDLEVSTDFKWLVALEQLVHECRQRECSKSGDHILAPLAFALHEKFAPTDAESVSILENARKLLDHRSSTVDLYIGFTRFLIASMKNLDILSRVDVTASQTRICRTKVPSWVPPFNAEGVTSLIDDVLFRQYDAASFLGTYIPAQGIQTHLLELPVRVVFFAQILQVSNHQAPADTTTTWLSHVCNSGRYKHEIIANNLNDLAHTVHQKFGNRLAFGIKYEAQMRKSRLSCLRSNLSASTSLNLNVTVSQQAHRKLFRFDMYGTSSIGLCPISSRVSDHICVMQGARVPFIVRSSGKAGRYTLVGEAFAENFMRGELGRFNFADREISLI